MSSNFVVQGVEIVDYHSRRANKHTRKISSKIFLERKLFQQAQRNSKFSKAREQRGESKTRRYTLCVEVKVMSTCPTIKCRCTGTGYRRDPSEHTSSERSLGCAKNDERRTSGYHCCGAKCKTDGDRMSLRKSDYSVRNVGGTTSPRQWVSAARIQSEWIRVSYRVTSRIRVRLSGLLDKRVDGEELACLGS